MGDVIGLGGALSTGLRASVMGCRTQKDREFVRAEERSGFVVVFVRRHRSGTTIPIR